MNCTSRVIRANSRHAMLRIKTRTRIISDQSPTYIIAEIGSNFDGSLKKAFKMIDLAAEVGADCAKFQSFLPDKIISKSGFGKTRNSFQAKWKSFQMLK